MRAYRSTNMGLTAIRTPVSFRVSFFSVVTVSYWLLAIATLLNLNLVGRLGLGFDRAFSPLILFCCLVLLLIGAASVPWQQALGISGFSLVAALTTYVVFGLLMGFANGLDSHPEKDFWHFLSAYTKSIVIIVAVAFGSRILLYRVGAQRVLHVILLLLTLNCALVVGSSVVLDEGNRLSGTLGDPNHAGFYGCLTAGLALSHLAFGQRRGLAFLALSISAFLVVGTFSRAAILILTVLVLIFFFRSRQVARGLVRWAVAVSLVGFVLLALFESGPLKFDDDQMRRLRSLSVTSREGHHDSSFSQRLFLLELAWKEIENSPYFGSGLGNLQRLDGAPLSKLGQVLGAHNQYLVFVGEAGIIPLAFFLFFLGLQLKKSWSMTSVSTTAVGAWTLSLSLFLMTSHAILLQRFSNFVVGLSCAIVTHGIRRSRMSLD